MVTDEKKKSSTCCLNVPSVTNVFCGMKKTVFGLNGRNLITSPEKENQWCNQSFPTKTPRTVKKSTTSGGRTKEAKERWSKIFCFRPPTWRQWRHVKTPYSFELNILIVQLCLQTKNVSRIFWNTSYKWTLPERGFHMPLRILNRELFPLPTKETLKSSDYAPDTE